MNLSKDKLTEILILGGGVSAERFIRSLIFNNNYNITVAGFKKLNRSKNLSLQYNLKYIYFYEIVDFNKYDIIIVSLPTDYKYDIIKYIVNKNYLNKFVIEKPFAMTIAKCDKIIELIKNNDFVVPHTRTYLNDSYHFNHKSDKLIWSVPDNKNLDIYKENLPHIIQLLIDSNFSLKNLLTVEKRKEKIIIKCENSEIIINFKVNNGIYILNNSEYHKINYQLANNTMISYLLSKDYNKKKELQNIRLNVEIFEKIYNYEVVI